MRVTRTSAPDPEAPVLNTLTPDAAPGPAWPTPHFHQNEVNRAGARPARRELTAGTPAARRPQRSGRGA